MNKNMLLAILKTACLLIYGLALASLSGRHVSDLTNAAQMVAAAFIGIHVLELLFVFKALRRLPASLSANILLTLLFGVVHWKPLMDAQKRGNASPNHIA